MVKNTFLYTVGGGTYVALEFLYRARSHWTMFVLGGGCFLAIGQLGRSCSHLSPTVRAVIGSFICTAGELLTGLAFNRNYAIWDYRGLPLNFRGQICLPFSLLWIPLCALGAEIFQRLDKKLP